MDPMARAERERVVQSVYEKWNRPDPTRPNMARPAISATQVRTLKKGRKRTARVGTFWPVFGPGPAPPPRSGPARPGSARLGPAWPWKGMEVQWKCG